MMLERVYACDGVYAYASLARCEFAFAYRSSDEPPASAPMEDVFSNWNAPQVAGQRFAVFVPRVPLEGGHAAVAERIGQFVAAAVQAGQWDVLIYWSELRSEAATRTFPSRFPEVIQVRDWYATVAVGGGGGCGW